MALFLYHTVKVHFVHRRELSCNCQHNHALNYNLLHYPKRLYKYHIYSCK
nr:MAG TPA: hypothetical protein [Caudoviricetes sp.]